MFCKCKTFINVVVNVRVKNISYFNIKFQTCPSSTRKNAPPWDVLFFGTDNFALESLKALCSKLRTGTLMGSLGVVTKPGTVVYKFGQTEGLPIYKWPLDVPEIEARYDVGMVVSFGNLIPKAVIDAFPLGCINVHGSLLPRWRGPAPVVHTLIAGDTEAGVTVMRIRPHKFDVGEIVRQYRVSVAPDETGVELEERLAKLGSLLLRDCLRDLPRCLDMAIPQPHNGVTYAPKVNQKMSVVCWRRSSAEDVYNLHRALSHIYPLRTHWHQYLVKFKEISLDLEQKDVSTISTDPLQRRKSALNFLNVSSQTRESKTKVFQFTENAGKCVFNKEKKCLKVLCADGKYIVVNKLQIGGKLMSGGDFYNGYMSKRKETEWVFPS